MTPAQYLSNCKTKLGHISDYELAKRWQIDNGYMSKLMRGTRPVNAHVAFLVATTLELDPACVLAEIESQQQTGKAQEFWKSFLSRVCRMASLMALTLALLASAGLGSDQGINGGRFRRRGCYA